MIVPGGGISRDGNKWVACRPGALVVERDQSPVGDGDAVGVARQIAQHLFGSAEWAFAVHHPFTVAQWCQERGEVLRVGKRGMPVEEL